jgi:hypothetical protein
MIAMAMAMAIVFTLYVHTALPGATISEWSAWYILA